MVAAYISILLMSRELDLFFITCSLFWHFISRCFTVWTYFADVAPSGHLVSCLFCCLVKVSPIVGIHPTQKIVHIVFWVRVIPSQTLEAEVFVLLRFRWVYTPPSKYPQQGKQSDVSLVS